MSGLGAYDRHAVGAMLDCSPGKLARRLHTSARVARGLQHYLVCVLVAAHRRVNAGDAASLERRADAILASLPPKVRHDLLRSMTA